MLITAKALTGYRLASLDGELGSVREFYFDDQHWTIRYLVAATGAWLIDRQVLISPYALSGVNRADGSIGVGLTKKQIENSPRLDSDKPVSHQFEDTFYGFYGWPMYSSGDYRWGPSPYLVRDREQWRDFAWGNRTWDPHLRSTRDVTGHHLEATDGAIGHVDDFVIDDETWAIRYLIVDTKNWWPGKKVLISPQWIERVSWIQSKVFIALTREAIKGAPEYTGDAGLSRDFETRLHSHYNRDGYWVDESACSQGALKLH
jgi:hypothetical protein